MEDYEEILPRGHDRIAQTLIARHNIRMENIPKSYDDFKFEVMSSIVPVTHLDLALDTLGANPLRPPPQHAGGLPDLLAWGVDSVVSTARLLLSGQVLGAAIMVRNQLERWVAHRAVALRLEQQQGESTTDFVARAWSQPDPLYYQWYDKHIEVFAGFPDPDIQGPAEEPSTDHLHVFRSNGLAVCPGTVYGLLSEFLHLRELGAVTGWDAELLRQDDGVFPSVMLAAGTICDAIFLALREVRLAAIELAKRRGKSSLVVFLSSGMDAISVIEHQTEKNYEAIPFGHARAQPTKIPPVAALAPLLPEEGLSRPMTMVVEQLANDFDAVRARKRPTGSLYRDDELLVRTFCWHRRRSIHFARRSLEAEKEVLGADFNIESMSGRSARWALLTEAASVLALWHPRASVRVVAAAVASSMRSAYWLWLEDDDRAMAVLRSCLEYVARLRTWRRNPNKAQILEDRPSTTPRDWIEGAGWKRLSLLNQALGEFAHARRMEKWPTARQLLSDLQLDLDSEKAIFTARGSAIDFTASLAAREIASLLEEVSSGIADAVGLIFNDIGFELDEDAFDVEAQFAHIWALRSQRFRTQP